MYRETIRKFIEKEVVPLVEEAETEGKFPLASSRWGHWVYSVSGTPWKWGEGVRIRCQNAFSQKNLIGFARELRPALWSNDPIRFVA